MLSAGGAWSRIMIARQRTQIPDTEHIETPCARRRRDAQTIALCVSRRRFGDDRSRKSRRQRHNATKRKKRHLVFYVCMCVLCVIFIYNAIFVVVISPTPVARIQRFKCRCRALAFSRHISAL